MKITFCNLTKESPTIRVFCPLPIIFWAKDKEDENELFSFCFVVFFWGGSVSFNKKPKPKTYAVCKHPIPRILTREKEYEIIKKVGGDSYVVKRDDDSIDKVSVTRFHPCYER